MSDLPERADGCRPRIAVVTWFYDDQPGFQDFRYRIESLQRQFEVLLVLRDERFRAEFPVAGAQFRIVATAGSGSRDLLGYLLKVRRLILRERPATVVLLGAQLAMVSLLPIARPVALYWNEHPTHTFHGARFGWVSRALSATLVALSFAGARRANLVMPIGEAHRDDLTAHGVDPSRVRMLYMGAADRFEIDRAGGAHEAAGSPELSLIYTGTVAAERGRDVMLDGLALARSRGIRCRLTMVGATGEQRCYCERRGVELGLGASLTVIGRVPGDAIPNLLTQADAGICAWEDRIWWRFNPPTKLFEYLVAGLPVLASRIRTHTLYLEEGRNGLTFDYDPASLADAIERLDAMRSKLPTMKAEIAAASKRYLWREIEPAFIAAIRSLMPADFALDGVPHERIDHRGIASAADRRVR